jgi:alpha-ribazole phosphatase
MSAHAGGGTRLVLIRHAQPAEEVRGRCYGSLDVSLSAKGQQLAQQLGQAFSTSQLAAIYTSPRLRAVETAAALAAPHALAPIPVDALREIDFGDFEGRSYDEIAELYPDLFNQWMERPTLVQFPGGESFAALRDRVLAASEAIRTRHAGQTAAIVAHGGVLRAILADCLTMPAEAIFRLDQEYGAIDVVEWIDDVPIVRLVNGAAPAGIAPF